MQVGMERTEVGIETYESHITRSEKRVHMYDLADELN
jgi:hypothetical protein